MLSVHSNISYKQKIKPCNTIHVSPDGDLKGNNCQTSQEQPKVRNLCAGRAMEYRVLSECYSWISRLFSAVLGCRCPCHDDVGLERGFFLVDVACA